MELRLALLAPGELFGGVERHLLGLCSHFRRIDQTPLLILFHDSELARQAREAGLEPVILQQRLRYDPVTGARLARLLEDRRINVVHAHGYKAIVTLAVARFFAPGGTHVVVKTEHGLPECWPGRRLRSRLNHRLGAWATRREAAAICYVTQELARYFEASHSRIRRFVIHNGIAPLDRGCYPCPPELEEGRPVFGIVGRVTEVKGIEFALNALASPSVPNSTRLVVIGSGPLEMQLRDLADRLGLGERVGFLGFRADVLDFLAHLDGLLIPSAHEGLPYTLLEAMSLGVPIIATKVGGMAEVLTDGETALFVPARDPASLAAAIQRVVCRPDLARSLGRAAAALQRKSYDLDAMGERYHRVYLDALRQRKAGAP